MDRRPLSRARRGAFVSALALAALALIVSPASTQAPAASAGLSVEPVVADQPGAVARALQAAYRALDLERFGALLTDDYRFHPYDEAGRSWDLDGFDRAFELTSAFCLFRADTSDTVCSDRMPLTRSLECRLRGLRLADDPEHPDSTEHYGLAIAEQFQVVVGLANGDTLETEPGQHVFHVVRGDAARLSHGQPADAQHWYLRRWIAYTDSPGPSGPGTPHTTPTTSGVLAVRPLVNPCGPELGVAYALVGSAQAELAVYDVQGRRRTGRTLSAGAGGEQRVALGEGARLQPGIYWVRLTQPGQRAVSRMVTVR